ncbi:MAG TPA: acyloxyacyl hydrolase [Caulobacteraceae bacterium]|jgi:hypothetical protein
MVGAPPTAQAGGLDQIWVGGYAHDVSDLRHGKESGTGDVQVEIDSARPAWLRFMGAPRLNAALSLNSAGLTNFGSAGLTWNHRLIGPLYGSLDLGFGLTDGVANPPPGPRGAYDLDHRLLLGSKVLFREAAGVDWRLSRRWSIGAQFVHLSNGLVLAHRYNQGINNVGLRLGYRFR